MWDGAPHRVHPNRIDYWILGNTMWNATLAKPHGPSAFADVSEDCHFVSVICPFLLLCSQNSELLLDSLI